MARDIRQIQKEASKAHKIRIATLSYTSRKILPITPEGFMKKQKLKLNKAQMQELAMTMQSFMSIEFDQRYAESAEGRIVLALMPYIRLKILQKLLQDKEEYSLTLKDYQSIVLLQMFEVMQWQNISPLGVTVMHEIQTKPIK